MTPEDRQGLQWLLGETARLTKDFVNEKIKAATAPLEARIKELEAREYRGVWAADKRYAKHAMVTFDGSLWIARSDSLSIRPGTGPAWQLACRKGTNGKDLRDAAR